MERGIRIMIATKSFLHAGGKIVRSLTEKVRAIIAAAQTVS